MDPGDIILGTFPIEGLPIFLILEFTACSVFSSSRRFKQAVLGFKLRSNRL